MNVLRLISQLIGIETLRLTTWIKVLRCCILSSSIKFNYVILKNVTIHKKYFALSQMNVLRWLISHMIEFN